MTLKEQFIEFEVAKNSKSAFANPSYSFHKVPSYESTDFVIEPDSVSFTVANYSLKASSESLKGCTLVD